MPRICINCGSKLVEGSPCSCTEHTTNIATTTSQTSDTDSAVVQEKTTSDSVVAENSAKENKTIQINIDQEMVDKCINETKKYLGTGITFFMEFIKKPLSMTMYSQLGNSISMFFIVLQALAFILFEVMLVKNIQHIIEKILGSLAYWIDLNSNINYGGICFKGALIIVGSMTTLVLLMSIVSKKIGKASIGLKRVLSIAVVSTIPLTLGYLGGTIMLFIMPAISVLCIIIGLMISIILGSYSLLSVVEINRDKGIYAVAGIYLVQVILIAVIIKIVMGM